jgi:hypothetical protein
VSSRPSDQPEQPDRQHVRTSERVERMSDEARAEIARTIAAGRGLVADPRFGRLAEAEEAALAEERARVKADLHRTERRLIRLARSGGGGRYQMGAGSGPKGRYARLLSRADRLERRLRSLR